ncbi:MAG: hypothetical protein AAB666_02615 [Patescibacteria group bacterium]
MPTIGEVKDQIKGKLMQVRLFGCASEWMQQFNEIALAVGQAVADDHGVSLEQARTLPDDTPLGPQAEVAYKSFCDFLAK